MKNPLITIRGLTKYFKSNHCVLKDLNLTIYSGDIYGIMGPSGAGKSTLIRCLIGLEQLDQGSIVIQGENITAQTKQKWMQLRQQIGMIFQHFYLFSARTVAQNIAYPLEICGIPTVDQQKRVDELLQLVKMEHKRDHYPSQLSGGEKQRVGIARALANHPPLLLCDEPTSALDPKTARSILQLLYDLNQTTGLTIVMITHQIEAIKQICNRAAVLSHGHIVEEGEVRTLLTRPQHSVTRHLLHLDAEHIPADLINRCHATRKLVRLSFEGQQAKEPILSQLVKTYQIEANILSGGLDYLQNMVIGHLIIELSGPAHEFDQALTFLKDQHVACEVLA